MADEKPDLLNDDHPDVTKEDYKALHRVYPELGQGGSIDDIERNNAYAHIIKNRTKFKDDPFTDEEIRDMSANREKKSEKKNPLHDHPSSSKSED